MVEVLIEEGIENAVYAALIAVAPASVGVFQHVPSNRGPDYIVIGKIDAENLGSKGEVDARGQFEIACFHEGPARSGLWALMRIAFNALHDQLLTADGVHLGRCHWAASASDHDPEAETDNVRYLGLMIFEISAEPAE
ncbi:Protein of unknown function [Sphingomonas laterariae]|uniref:DUF3168 domain-containing protein n=1 Tax=Edaphosphingomonas laterariae TaxID=861865 RepID=A0A239FAW3_9SPHN|nr:hypothetical protein [Sphingomonas laterariae]SNS53224.1 Protein of unknown function [Sphingomonas laterariae]